MCSVTAALLLSYNCSLGDEKCVGSCGVVYRVFVFCSRLNNFVLTVDWMMKSVVTPVEQFWCVVEHRRELKRSVSTFLGNLMNRLKRSSNILHLVTFSDLGQNKKHRFCKTVKSVTTGLSMVTGSCPGLGQVLPSSQD